MLIHKFGPTQNDSAAETRSLTVIPPPSAGKYSRSVVNGWPVIDRFEAEDGSARLNLADFSHLPKAVVSSEVLSTMGDTATPGRCLQTPAGLVGLLSNGNGLLLDVALENDGSWPEHGYTDITDGLFVLAIWGSQAGQAVQQLFATDVARPDVDGPVFTTATSHGFSVQVFRLNKKTPGFLFACERSHAHNLYDLCLTVAEGFDFGMSGVGAGAAWLDSDDRAPCVNRTPVHTIQAEANGACAVFGTWERIIHFGDPESEAMAAHEGGIVMDSSSFGKFWISGPDAAKVISRITTKKVDNLAVGKIAHYVSCSEEGTVRDDGTIIRRSDDEYYLTTGTLRAAEFEDWCSRWAEGEGWNYEVSNLSQSYAVVSLAGPHAREIMSTLTDADLSNEALPFMFSTDGYVADVPCMILRLGFLGEGGYELHMPSAQAEHVWNALMKAGEPYGVQITAILGMSHLRLEKGHILPGHDTDPSATLFEAGLGFAWDRNNTGFVGEDALVELEKQPQKRRLVRFRVDGRSSVNPTCVMIADGKPVGRMPSVHYSQILGQTIGICLADNVANLVVDGKAQIQTDDGIVDVEVIDTHAFFDVAGERMKA